MKKRIASIKKRVDTTEERMDIVEGNSNAIGQILKDRYDWAVFNTRFTPNRP